MVQTRSRIARTMDDRILALEAQLQKLNRIDEFEEKLKKLNKVDELQDMVWGLRDELRVLVLAMQANNGGQWWPWQLGNVKEYNEIFDDVVTRFQAQMAEEYLVVAYLGRLKDEICGSVELFQPRTMLEARSIARAEEIFLQWRLEKARRVLKDKEDGGFCQKTPQEVQEISVCPEKNDTQEVHPEVQEPFFAQEKNDEVLVILKDEGSSSSTQEFVSSLGFVLPISYKSDSVLPRDNAKITSALNGSLCFDSTEGFRAVLYHMDRREAVYVTGFQLVPCRVLFSPAYPVFSTDKPAANKGLQLACIFLKGQNYLKDQEKGPSLLLQLGLQTSKYIRDRLLQNWLSFFQCSPAQSLLQTWFRGELIKMLFGSGLDLLLLFVPASNK